jgi:hypothetical protein
MKLRVALAALLGAVVGASVTFGVTAVASGPSTPLAPTDTIAVCVNPSTGALKPRTLTLNKVPSSCPVGTTLRTWQPQSLAGTDAGTTFISPSTTGCPANEWKPVLQSLGGTVKWSATGENGDANGCVGLTNGVWKIVVSLSSLPSSFSWIGGGEQWETTASPPS